MYKYSSPLMNVTFFDYRVKKYILSRCLCCKECSYIRVVLRERHESHSERKLDEKQKRKTCGKLPCGKRHRTFYGVVVPHARSFSCHDFTFRGRVSALVFTTAVWK